jgi:hypothetical protein
MFHNFESIIYQIKTTLLNSSDIKKLLFYNTSNALSRVEPTYDETKISIYVRPIVYVYDDSPEYGISSFITIELAESLILDGSIQNSMKISVACARDIWELDNERIRPIALISFIANMINGFKFDAAGILELRVVKEVFFNNELIGYTMLFDITEEKGDAVHEF